MCTIAVLLGVITDAPLVIAANRDELYARPSRPPERWASGFVAGVDVLSGGTWLAVRRDGRFAAVTNQRALSIAPPAPRSRGSVVVALIESADPRAYVESLDPTQYASMNLVWGDATGVSIAYVRKEGTIELESLEAGVHVLCNDRLGAPGFPRGERLRDVLLRRTEPFDRAAPAIEAALRDHERVAPTEVPPSHLPPDLARALTATCIHSDHYGTRSSTIVAAAPGRILAYRHADGPPCTAPFADRSSLL